VEKQKYLFYTIWFDPIVARTHDLPHTRRARLPVRHRRGSQGLTFHINRVGLEQSGPHHHLIKTLTCSRHDIAGKIAELALNNNH
jgi:hypothetical protein